MLRVVEIGSDGIVQQEEWLTRVELTQELGISSPTISRWINLLSDVAWTRYKFVPRDRLFDATQADGLRKVAELYAKGFSTRRVKLFMKGYKPNANTTTNQEAA